MKYFHRPDREHAEGQYLKAEFDKTLASSGQLNLSGDTVVANTGTSLTRLDGELLAMHRSSASWAFLSETEAAVFERLRSTRFQDLVQWIGSYATTLDYVSHLWRRGLVSLNGEYAVSTDMFAQGANYREGHLVELLLTEKCNLACPYCLAGAHQKMPAMDEPLAKRTIDLAFAMEEADTIAFEFAGGEPFLKYPLMRSLVTYINAHPARGSRRLFLSIQTNATLLNQKKVEWIKEHGIRVGVSLDGGAQAQNKSRPQVNGKESHSSLMKGIELLKANNVPFGGLVVLNRSNIDNAEELADFMLKHEIHGFRINPVAYLGDARKNWQEVGLEQEEVIVFFQKFMQSLVKNGHPILEDNIHSMCNFLTSKQRRTRCMRADCGAGDTFQSVTANGDIYPCGRSTQSPGLKLGNVFDSIDSLSQPARHSIRIEEIRYRKPVQFDDCSVCNYQQLCQAGCSAQSWERFGTVRHKTPDCQFYKTLYPWLMRWLCFDRQAYNHLNRYHYFDGEGQLFEREFLTSGTDTQTKGNTHWVAAPEQALWPTPLSKRQPKHEASQTFVLQPMSIRETGVTIPATTVAN